MTVFVDTSAWYAALVEDDERGAIARNVFGQLARRGEHLITHNYVVLESVALMHRRLGKRDVARFLGDLLPAAEVEWVQPSLHDIAQAAYLSADSKVSFVDHVSFALMRERDVSAAFAFDDDFAAQGFSLLG